MPKSKRHKHIHITIYFELEMSFLHNTDAIFKNNNMKLMEIFVFSRVLAKGKNYILYLEIAKNSLM